jgi:hypothetical protein
MKTALYVALGLFAFVVFHITSATPPKPAPAPVVAVPAAAPQDAPVDPAGIPRVEPPAPKSAAKPPRPKIKMFSRAYVGSRDDVELEVADRK